MDSDQVFRALQIVTMGSKVRSVGVILSSQLDKFFKAKSPKIFVCNTEPSPPGQHWVLLACFDGSIVEVFDSYGRNLKSYSQYFSPIELCRPLENCQQLQQYSSSVCAYYCLMFSYFRARNFSYCQFLGKFTKNLLQNDIKVTNFFDNYVKPFL